MERASFRLSFGILWKRVRKGGDVVNENEERIERKFKEEFEARMKAYVKGVSQISKGKPNPGEDEKGT